MEKGISDDSSTLPECLADQSRAFGKAARAAIGEEGACASANSPEASFGRNLADAARRAGKVIAVETLETWPVVSNMSSEHDVRWDETSGRVVKTTKEIYYGEIPVPEDGRVMSRGATVIEYLQRMQLQIEVFYTDVRWEGIFVPEESLFFDDPTVAPMIVISQPWYRAAGYATAKEIAKYLEDMKFEKIPRSFFGWMRREDGVVIQDATPDNFILTEVGLVPIDLQMNIFSELEMRTIPRG